MADVIIALGSNLGDRAGNLRRALHYLQREGFRLTAASSIWETPPFPEGQPSFYNAAIRGETRFEPEPLLRLLKRCEHDLGRRETWRWGPRVVDLDILIYDSIEMATPGLTIPHPRIAERAFVLVPLNEVWDGPIPVVGRSPAELLEPLDRTGIRRLDRVLVPSADVPGTAHSH